MKRNNYKTKQKEQILQTIIDKKEFSIKELELLLPHIGQTTIYRIVNKLYKDNELIKLVNKNEVRYQYIKKCDCHHHMYLKCSICGEIKHINCDFIDEVKKHIKTDHDFEVYIDDLILNGICQKCRKKAK